MAAKSLSESSVKLATNTTSRRAKVRRSSGQRDTAGAAPQTSTNSRRPDRVSAVLLAAAAALSLVAVVQQLSSPNAIDPTSPDAEPPAVFVHTD